METALRRSCTAVLILVHGRDEAGQSNFSPFLSVHTRPYRASSWGTGPACKIFPQNYCHTWSTSSMLRSCSPPFSGLYTSVPLMITVCAGRLTPHARVAVHTSTFGVPKTRRNHGKGGGIPGLDEMLLGEGREEGRVGTQAVLLHHPHDRVKRVDCVKCFLCHRKAGRG